MDRTLDIFKNDAFSQATLQTVLPTMPFTPGALGQMNLFNPHNIDTEIVLIYQEQGQIKLIPTTARGAPDIMSDRRVGSFRALKTTRLSKKDSVRASEMLAIADLSYPLSQRLVTAQGLVAKRMGQLQTDMEATKELHRLGALQGKLLDADGTTVIYNYFDNFGIADPTPVSLNFGTMTDEDAAATLQEDFYMPMVRSLQLRNGGMGDVSGIEVAALCGDTFWSKLIRNVAVREVWKLEMYAQALNRASNPLVVPPRWQSLDFGGVRWIHYMGAVSGPIAVPTNDAIIFPIGAKDMFEVYFSPGETLSSVGQPGNPLYPIVRVDPRDDPEFIDIHLRSYPLYACIYPQALMRATAA